MKFASVLLTIFISPFLYADEHDEMLERHENEIEIIREEQSTLWEAFHKGTILHSFGSFNFEKYTNSLPEFNNFSLAAELKSSIDNRIKLHATLEFNGIEDSNGTDEVTVNVVTSSIDFIIIPALVFRGGIFLNPLIKYNLNYESYKRNFIAPPHLAHLITPSPLSDFGIGFTGTIDLIENIVFFNYKAYGVNGFRDDISDTAGLQNAEQHFGDNNADKSYVSRLELNLLEGIIFGGAYYYGKFDPQGDESISAYDISYTLRLFEFEVIGEYLVTDLSGGTNRTTGLPFPNKLRGYYTEVSYFMYPDFLELSRDSRVNLSFRYDYGKIESTQNTTETTYSVGIGYNPYQYFKVKTEYQFNSGTLARGNNDGILLALTFKF